MPLSFSDLSKTFSKQANWTNNIIAKGLTTQLGVLEETITDMNLLAIADKHDKYVLTKKFSRREEGASTGADWLWCIGEPGSWLCLIIQAKIVKSYNGTCPQLNYKRGKQCQLLKTYARKHGLVPLYCIYNHIPEGYSPPPKARPALSAINSFEWACSLLSPERVQNLVRAKRTKHLDLLTFAIPWVHLFNQANLSGESRLGIALADAYAGAMNEVSEEALNPNQAGIYRGESTDTGKARDLLKQELPSFVSRLVLGRGKASIAGLSIISSIPIEEALGFKSVPQIPEKPLDLMSLKDLQKTQRILRKARS